MNLDLNKSVYNIELKNLIILWLFQIHKIIDEHVKYQNTIITHEKIPKNESSNNFKGQKQFCMDFYLFLKFPMINKTVVQYC